MEKLFTGNGIEIIKRGDQFYMVYDAGEICDRIVEIQISSEEVEIAKKSSMDSI